MLTMDLLTLLALPTMANPLYGLHHYVRAGEPAHNSHAYHGCTDYGYPHYVRAGELGHNRHSHTSHGCTDYGYTDYGYPHYVRAGEPAHNRHAYHGFTDSTGSTYYGEPSLWLASLRACRRARA